MNLLFKPDWEATKDRYLAWWAHGYFGRCALAIHAPKRDLSDIPPPPEAQNVEEQWYDLDAISARQAYAMSRTFYGGEALPVWSGGYPGHTAIPAFLGCPTKLDMHTGWWEPILTGADIAFEGLRIDRSCRDYRLAVDLLRRGGREMAGKGLVTAGAFGGCGDTLAALRGTERLLFDCIERPDQVRAADRFLMEMWFEHYNAMFELIREADEGSTCWFELWSPGKFYSAHNDFAYNLSPTMFRDLFLETIRRQTEFLTHTVYHVDGVGNFTHVDALVELPRLQAFQIAPGAGKPSALHYPEVLRKVQAAGKNLWISLPVEEVRPALEQLSARGLFIVTRTRTEDEAKRLLDAVERWSVDRG